MTQQPTLQTERLILRPFQRSDARDVQRLAGDRAIADTIASIPHPYQNGVADEWISKRRSNFENQEEATFAIALRNIGELIGAIGLDIDNKNQNAELGYWVGKPYWNNGYCTEAAFAILDYGFTIMDLNRIYAYHMKRNPASGRVMEKLGMTREGMARQHVKKWEVFEDLVLYGMLRSEWEQFSKRTYEERARERGGH